MISTKYLLQTCKDVPDTWMFEHYCKLAEKLIGQDVKINSVFNTKDKTPSMCIFFFDKTGKYVFKDFSTGKGGSAIKMVQELFNESFGVACARVLQDYNKYILLNNGTQHKITEFKVQSRFKVTTNVKRQWTTRDKRFWEQFNIGSKLLHEFNVYPLESYTMTKEEQGELKSLEINGLMLYGYYRNDGTLYKIYQPNVKEHKFIKVKDYLQGNEQLNDESSCLLICSSLKDAMTIKSLGVVCNFIVPDSENTVIKAEIIETLKERYKFIFTLFDNDEAGINAMKKYKEVYGLDYVYFDLEKDVADAVKVHGVDKVKEKLVPLINKKFI
jgi:hypothetical protein